MKPTGAAMNSVKSIKKPPLTRFGGRPPKLTFEAKTVLLDSLRDGRSYADACLAAGITPVTLFNHRRTNSRFDAQCRAARATGKKLPQTMPYGIIVPNSGIVADEKERARLQRLFSRKLGHTLDFDRSPALKRLRRRRENCQDEVVKRLLKLREDYETDLHKAKAENVQIGPIDGNLMATKPATLGETTDGIRGACARRAPKSPASASKAPNGFITPMALQLILNLEYRTCAGAPDHIVAEFHANGNPCTITEMEAANIIARHLKKALSEIGIGDKRCQHEFGGVRYE